MRKRRLVISTLLTIAISLVIEIAAFAAVYDSIDTRFENIGIVNVPTVLNIRDKPQLNSNVIGLIPNKGGVEVLKYGTEWSYIQSGTVKGYVMSKYIDVGDQAKESATVNAVPTVKIITPVNMYRDTNMTQQWDTLNSGSTFTVLEDSGDWLCIAVGEAKAYIQYDGKKMQTYQGLPEAARYSGNISGTRKKLVDTALQYLGNKYVWGGNNPNTGADCSGFVKYLYQNVAGISLPRVSSQQCYVGTLITSTEMQPGDLLYYARPDGTVHHVAMYIGSGTIIHAASTAEGIRLSSWNYNTPKYIRRLID